MLRAYQVIDSELRLQGKSLSQDFHIPSPIPLEMNLLANVPVDNPLMEAIQGQQMFATLTEEQALVVQTVLGGVEDGAEPAVLFVDGPGGTGKTYLYQTLIAILKGRSMPYIAVAPTGIAANLLPGGMTIHAQFKIPVMIDANTTIGVSANSAIGRQLRQARVIIWDEAGNTNCNLLDIVDAGLRNLCQDQRPFGGKMVLLGGDFRQILPVVKGAGRGREVRACIKSSPLWPTIRRFSLHGDESFAQWQLDVGNGSVPAAQDGNIDLPPDLLCRRSLVQEIFGERITEEDLPSLDRKVILAPTNEECHHINSEAIHLLPGPPTHLASVDKHDVDPAEHNEELMPTDYLNSLIPSNFPPHDLVLKVGAIVILVRNLSVKDGLCNGARLRFDAITLHCLRCTLLTGSMPGVHLLSLNDPVAVPGSVGLRHDHQQVTRPVF